MAASMLIAQVSDPHVVIPGARVNGRVDTHAMLAACLERLVALSPVPDVLLLSGDLTEHGRPAEYAALRALLDPLPMPWYLIPGNHDRREAIAGAFGDLGWMKSIDCAPFIQYAVGGHPLRIVALDSLEPGLPGGRLCARRLAWLDEVLAAAGSAPTMLMLHHPPVDVHIGHMDAMGLADRDLLAAVLRAHPQVVAVVCGHLHRMVHAGFRGVPVIACPSTAHQIHLDLSEGAPERFSLEPPGFVLHAWSDAGLVSHLAFAGVHPGPFGFS
jgi:Icc protein